MRRTTPTATTTTMMMMMMATTTATTTVDDDGDVRTGPRTGAEDPLSPPRVGGGWLLVRSSGDRSRDARDITLEPEGRSTDPPGAITLTTSRSFRDTWGRLLASR